MRTQEELDKLRAYKREWARNNRNTLLAWREKNKEKVRAYARKWARNNKENNKQWQATHPEKMSEYRKRWIENNPSLNELVKLRSRKKYTEENNRKSREFRARNRAYYAEYLKKWRLENPEKEKAYTHKRLAIKRGVQGTFTGDDIARIRRSQNDRCYYCCKVLSGSKWHIDHKVPLAKGGSNYPHNLSIACESCNCKKSANSVDEFALRLLNEY